jgi:outer membrane autotransporter protein
MSFGSNFSHYSGDSQINTFGLQSILSYGVLVDNKWLVSPYVGLTYVKISLDGYTEKFIDGNYTPVANYGNVNDRSENILLGLKLKGKLSPKLDALMDFGIEKDINRSNENYSANGFYSFLIPFNYAVPLNSDFQKNRIFASLGVIYEITENQHLSFNANYRQEQFQSSHSAASGLVYKISF